MKILKKWREKAVIMQVDIEIVSVSRTQFLNFGSLPPSGFYGYANLIMRDFSLPSIAISQPRQTLYYAVNEFAQSAWMQYHNMIRHQENSKGIEQLICFNTGLLGGACEAKPCKPIPEPSFIEFPLREVLINTYFGTQFNIELSYWKINNVLDNCGNIVSPKSNQKDGDKDEGLPPFGAMPQQAPNPSNPYGGFPPVSPSDREGIIDLGRLNDLAKPNPDNAPLPEDDGIRYAITGYARDYLNGCSNGLFEIFYLVSDGYTSPPNYSLNEVNTFTACGESFRTIQIVLEGNVLGGNTSIASAQAIGIVLYSQDEPIPQGFFYGWRRVS